MPKFSVPMYVTVDAETAEDAQSYVASNYVVCDVGTVYVSEDVNDMMVPMYISDLQDIEGVE